METGKLIKEARLAKGLTQEELGNIVGVQKSAIAKYESGRVVNIKRSTLKKLAAALDLRGADLIEDEKEKPAGEGELSAKKLEFIEKVKQMSEEELERLEQILRIVESTK